MIKRYKRILFGLIAAAVIAVIAYFGVLVVQNNQAKKAAEEAAKKIIFNFDALKISAMDIKNSTGEYSFVLGAEGWEITKGEEFKFSPDRFAEIAELMSELTATKVLKEELPDDLSPYGLDNPMEIVLKLSNGEEYCAQIGSKVPGDSYYYFKTGDGNTIYTITEDDRDKLSVEIADIKETLMFDAAATSDITYIKYTDHGEVVYEIERTGENDWEMKAPFKGGVVSNSEVSSISSMIIRAEASTFIDDGTTDKSEFGFDNPSYEIDLKSVSDEATLVFGNYYDDNEKYIYAYNKELDQVYVFEAASLGFVGTSTESVLYKRLRTESFDNITKFEINAFDTVIDIDYDYVVEEGRTPSYSVNGKSVERENETVLETFNNLINAICGLSYDYVSYDKFDTKDKTPAVKIVYRLKEGGDYTLELFENEKDDSLLYVVENGKYMSTLVKKSSVENGIILYYKDLSDLMK